MQTFKQNAAPREHAECAVTRPVYFTARQVAEMLAVNERTVLRWVQQDASIPVSRLPGRTVRFERAALLRWLERKKPRGARQVTQAATQDHGFAA
jgi:excisionase family DNA binding protein